MTAQQPSDVVADFTHLADLLKGAILDRDERSLSALLSNNVNTIIAALRAQPDAAAMREAAASLADKHREDWKVFGWPHEALACKALRDEIRALPLPPVAQEEKL